MRGLETFRRVEGTTAPSFQFTSSFSSLVLPLESTALGRKWNGPSGRAVRVAESSGVDYYVNLGSSLVTANSTDSMLFLGGTVEVLHPQPSDTYIAMVSISTTTGAVVNVTLGYGQ